LRVYDGLIAANWLPYNTKIRIPDMFGDKIFTVNDRMNPRYDTGRLDVWMPSRVDAKQFGIRHIRIQIVE
jgi:3D (Asp-Asp-Asp) domain-containing protein